jgi:dipeptidyl aminopeptidase/acylaminoacyl peptidase
MSEHTPMDPFETRLTALARSYTEPAVRSIDALGTARAAMASTSRGSVVGRLWPVRSDRRVALLLLLAALVITFAALAVALGSGPSLVIQVPNGPERIVFVRDGDLFIAQGDASGQTLIARGGADDVKFGYLTAAWSPDMRHIAAVRDLGGAFLTPGVDLMTAEGGLVRTVALDVGCGPSLSWSPDSSEVAIATCPADVRRDAIEPVEAGIGLHLAGLDASADRQVALPPEWQSVASARREVWIRPDLWARWSPDGRWIALLPIVAGQGGRYVVAVDGSGARRIEELTDDLGDRIESFDWSPDGRNLAISGTLGACVEAVCVGIVDSQGGPVTSTVMHPSAGDPNLHGKLFWPEFSPDGDRVAVLGGVIDFSSEPAVDTSTLYDYDLTTARFTELTSGSRSMIFDSTGAVQSTGTVTGELVAEGTVAWTPDGRGLLYLVRDDGDSAASWTLRMIDAAGGSPSSALIRGVQSFDIAD